MCAKTKESKRWKPAPAVGVVVDLNEHLESLSIPKEDKGKGVVGQQEDEKDDALYASDVEEGYSTNSGDEEDRTKFIDKRWSARVRDIIDNEFADSQLGGAMSDLKPAHLHFESPERTVSSAPCAGLLPGSLPKKFVDGVGWVTFTSKKERKKARAAAAKERRNSGVTLPRQSGKKH